jgi:hypothetical protein
VPKLPPSAPKGAKSTNPRAAAGSIFHDGDRRRWRRQPVSTRFPIPYRRASTSRAGASVEPNSSLPDWKLEGQTRLGSSWRSSSSRAPEPARARLVDSPGIGFSIITALRVCAAASAPLLPPSNRAPQPLVCWGAEGGAERIGVESSPQSLD